MAEQLLEADASWFPSLRPILASNPDLLSILVLVCRCCDREMRPLHLALPPVVDLKQWAYNGLSAIGDATPPDEREQVGLLPTILPCGHIVCRKCLYQDSQFDEEFLDQRINTDTFADISEDQEEQENFALACDMLIREENLQEEIISRDEVLNECLASGAATVEEYEAMKQTCPVDGCRTCSGALSYCLTDCTSWMEGVPFPTTEEELANVPLTRPEGQYVFANAFALRPTHYPRDTFAVTWIADMCHRCRAVREIARHMYAWNATHHPSERISICFVTDPGVRAEYEEDPRFETLRALSDWMTESYHAKVRATPWNVPPGGAVPCHARFVARQIDRPCICTIADDTWVEGVTPCDVFKEHWIWGDAVFDGWMTCQNYVSRARDMGLVP
ncbi:hypothetical protein SODALDRAFT_328533 [Sodiomyces alkalinus F11]|uniref:Zinc finger RING-type eukaryotic domain-containing protein n=1 Tax=Sodiomyces alkalinus (strain CBS 110278 / VKM F-3762 / F11) TaxID=1314773 RepID=A0A3N2PNU1_SODAK|nr:hypothetical protein SODALDRAFT_328533 [Sodiomyces alkalinus F11]ROT36163.1 hypothetical protein SODALDRAFT_328533 [Sodiomyces alkalinus F11]